MPKTEIRKIYKVGGSMVVVLPAIALKRAHLANHDHVEVTNDGRRIVLTKVRVGAKKAEVAEQKPAEV